MSHPRLPQPSTLCAYHPHVKTEILDGRVVTTTYECCKQTRTGYLTKVAASDTPAPCMVGNHIVNGVELQSAANASIPRIPLATEPQHLSTALTSDYKKN